METFSVHRARSELSKLIDRVLAGEEIIIAKAGKPVVRLVPVNAKAPRKPGLLKGRITTAKDFDAPLSMSVLAKSERRARRR